MTRTEHLTVCDLTLTTRSPLYIGSGNTCAKTDYLFDPRTRTVSMIDPEAFFDWLYKRHLADEYERFVLSGDTRLYVFLNECGISNKELDTLCLYKVSAEDALDDSHSLKEIHTFVRDSSNRAYIPGSSIKGALRTVILACMIAKEKKGTWPDSLEKEERARQMQTLEGEYLNTIALKKDKDGNTVNDPVNSILRGLSVSDSEPIPDAAFILTGKIDANEKGEYRKQNRLLCRECVRPGTAIRFKLTLDHSVLPAGYSAEYLMRLIRAFDGYYQKVYLSRFSPPVEVCDVSFQNALILGGGSGFFAKSLAQPYLGAQEGMAYTQDIMCEQFPKHKHEKDIEEHGISPHTMKYGRYRGELYPYGVCEVAIT